MFWAKGMSDERAPVNKRAFWSNVISAHTHKNTPLLTFE